jgi:hypothetical protein
MAVIVATNAATAATKMTDGMTTPLARSALRRTASII